MNNKLFTQIKNEWKHNLWLFMELFLVSVVMWYIVDTVYVRSTLYNEPKGFDISHCYYIETGVLTKKSDKFDPNDSVPAIHLDELCSRLEHNPAIEAVGLSTMAYPYNGSISNTFLRYDTISSEVPSVQRRVTPGFIKVFKYRGMNGETPEELASKLEGNNLLIADDAFGKRLKGGIKSIVGKEVVFGVDTTASFRVAASLQPIKYSEFIESSDWPSVTYLLTNDNRWIGMEICIRVRPEYDIDFAQKLLQDSPKKYNIGNLYISNITSFDDIRRNYISTDLTLLKMSVGVMCFMLLNIFLGLLGTFWFRTQQRKGEIALLKSFGSTNFGIYKRFILEGLIILAIVTVPAIIIDYNITNTGIVEIYKGQTFEITRFILTVTVSFLLIFLFMVFGISIPARKAMKLDPADALHEE